ncbi:MAG: tetratricopeptide repeat protein [Candidatus Hydrogenedentes bacterium]|nr:tetratricopeptide repeat protein [Candidatus Hydrogenedentota bacterium]
MARSISVAMIVKDESEQLPECLASIQSVADELCIVDTGSRDNTIEIARRFGAKVTLFLWSDDFAAARNESLWHCTKDWVFIVDADERVADGDVARLRRLADGPEDCCYRFVTRNYTNTANVSEFQRSGPEDSYARGFAGWFPSAKVRLFPNRHAARFEGQVHELVQDSLACQGFKIITTDIPIYHYPLERSPERIREKQQRYIRLGRRKVAENPNNPRAYVELANQYVEVGEYNAAVTAYREALRLNPRDAVVLKDLGAVLYLLKSMPEAKQSLILALRLCPELPEGWRNLGVIYVEQGRWDKAVECFERALALDPTWTDGHRYLSIALDGAERLEAAAAAARRAVEVDPASTESVELYSQQMRRLNKGREAEDFLSKVLHARNGARA